MGDVVTEHRPPAPPADDPDHRPRPPDGPPAPAYSSTPPGQDAAPPAVERPKADQPAVAPRPPGVDDFPETGPNSLASIGQRAAARIIDTLIIAIPFFLLAIPFIRIDGENLIFDTPLWFVAINLVVGIAYEVIMLTLLGRTLGKWLLGIRVARYADGDKPKATQAGQRVLLPSVPGALPDPFNLLEIGVYLTAISHPLRRGIHDHAAGTVVVRTR